MASAVGIVIVSHSAKIADGGGRAGQVRWLQRTTLIAAGGTDERRSGHELRQDLAGIGRADAGDGVVVLCDLGSAILTAETAVDFLDDAERASVVIADAPIVEGAVAAAVVRRDRGIAAEVAAAAPRPRASRMRMPTSASLRGGGRVERSAVLVNPSGLHARPAAELVKTRRRVPG